MTVSLNKRYDGSMSVTMPRASRRIQLSPEKVPSFHSMVRRMKHLDEIGCLLDGDVLRMEDTGNGSNYGIAYKGTHDRHVYAVDRAHKRNGERLYVMDMSEDEFLAMSALLDHAEQESYGRWQL